MEDPKIKDGWSQYAHTILSKLEELHADNKETKKAIDEIRLAIVKLEINKEEVTTLREWKKEVVDIWSPIHMEAAQKEVYIQKGKWTMVYGIMIAINVGWIVVMALLKK
jgi:hypothetical protein